MYLIFRQQVAQFAVSVNTADKSGQAFKVYQFLFQWQTDRINSGLFEGMSIQAGSEIV